MGLFNTKNRQRNDTMEKGTLIVKKKDRYIRRADGSKTEKLPNIFDVEEFIGQPPIDCEFLETKGQLENIYVDGKSLLNTERAESKKQRKELSEQKNVILVEVGYFQEPDRVIVAGYEPLLLMEEKPTKEYPCLENPLVFVEFKPANLEIVNIKPIHYFVPKDTFTALDLNKSNGVMSDNFYVFLQYFAYFDTKSFKIKNPRKELFNKNTLNFKFDKRLIDYAANTAKNIVETLYPESNRRILEPSSSWRTIIGLGGESVYEVSMTLHHIYGIPYIPASSIKGLLRNYLIATCFNKSEENAEKNKLMSVIFGSTDNQGKAVFFDAFPKTNPTIEADIMNVHYSSYYGGNDAPTDTSNPIPVQFLTVGKGTKFEIHIAYNSKDIKCADLFADEEKKELEIFKKIWERNPTGESITILDFVQLALDKALSEHGIGAKTAVGYGYMQE